LTYEDKDWQIEVKKETKIYRKPAAAKDVLDSLNAMGDITFDKFQ